MLRTRILLNVICVTACIIGLAQNNKEPAFFVGLLLVNLITYVLPDPD